MSNFKKTGSNEFTFFMSKSNLKLYWGSAQNGWGDLINDRYRYQETNDKTSMGDSIYNLKLEEGTDFYKNNQFKHFILIEESENPSEIISLLKARGFHSSGRGDMLGNFRRIWFTIPANNFIGVRGDGVFENNVLL
jgi:hypothetical protein